MKCARSTSFVVSKYFNGFATLPLGSEILGGNRLRNVGRVAQPAIYTGTAASHWIIGRSATNEKCAAMHDRLTRCCKGCRFQRAAYK